MWLLQPTPISKYLHHSLVMFPQDEIEAPANSRLHLSQPRQAKEQIHGQRDYTKVPTQYKPCSKSYLNFTGYPKTGLLLPIHQAEI